LTRVGDWGEDRLDSTVEVSLRDLRGWLLRDSDGRIGGEGNYSCGVTTTHCRWDGCKYEKRHVEKVVTLHSEHCPLFGIESFEVQEKLDHEKWVERWRIYRKWVSGAYRPELVTT